MDVTNIITLIGTVGGIQGIVELAKWWKSRRLRIREDEAGVEALENENTRKQIDWLESRLAERDRKIDSIYEELRAEQAKRIEEIHLKHKIELRLTEAEAKKCLVRGCASRVPPGEY